MLRTRPAPTTRNRQIHRSVGMGSLYMTLSGLGDYYDDAGVNPDYTLSSDQSLNIMSGPNPTAAELANAGYPMNSPVSSPSGGGWQTLAAALANDATQIALPLIRQATQQKPFFVTNPSTGQSVLYNPNSGAVQSGAGLLSNVTPTTLMIGAALLFGAIALSKRG